MEKYCKIVKVFRRAEKPWTLVNIVRTGLSLYPFVVIRNFSREEKKGVAGILEREKFDIIHAETFYVYPHIPDTTTPVVLVDQTIEYQVYQHYIEHFKIWFLKPLLWIDVLKIKYWETYFWKKAARTVAVSEADARKMVKLAPNLDVSVVPNGVDEDLACDIDLHYSKNILFVGNYDWMQNIEAAGILANKVFPIVLQAVPDARLFIAGQHTNKIADLKSRNVEFFDLRDAQVADDLKQIYKKSGILIAPLYGPGGTRLKILSAMSARLPVVTTYIGIEGIEAVNGESVLYGETPEELANLAIKLLKDKVLYQRIAENARKLVEQRYAYQAIAEKLDTIYQEVQNG